MKWGQAHRKAGKGSHCLGRMAAGGEEKRKKGWESHPVLLYKHGFMTHCPPPEATHSATNSWVASSMQLEDCCSSARRGSPCWGPGVGVGSWRAGVQPLGWSEEEQLEASALPAGLAL